LTYLNLLRTRIGPAGVKALLTSPFLRPDAGVFYSPDPEEFAEWRKVEELADPRLFD
jgi:hypothetical protein